MTRGSGVVAYFKIRGFFANSLMVTVQLEAAALCVSAGSAAVDLFADDLDRCVSEDEGETTATKTGVKRDRDESSRRGR